MLVELQVPEVATVVRWTLRIVLVFFLTWLIRRRPEQAEAEEEEDEADTAPKYNQNQSRQQRAGLGTGAPRLPNRRDPYAVGSQPNNSSLRQRNLPSYNAGGGPGAANGGSRHAAGEDIDDIISRMSKPKQMWEVHKPGDTAGAKVLKRGSGSSQDFSQSPMNAGTAAAKPPPAVSKDPAKRKIENMLHGHMRPVTWITLNRDCNLLFTCSKDKKVCVWSFPEGDALGSYEGHSGAVWACSATSDTRWLVTCGADQHVIVWEARTSEQLGKIELPGVVKFVEWAGLGGKRPQEGEEAVEPPSSERFVTCHNRFGSKPAALTVWNFDGEKMEQQTQIVNLPAPVNQVRWGRQDETLASAHDNGELVFWKAVGGERLRTLKVHEMMITKFDFNLERDLLATASSDMHVKLWDLGPDVEPAEHAELLYSSKTDRPANAVALGPLTREQARAERGSRPSGCSVIAGGGQDIRDVAMSSSSSDQFTTLLLRLGDAPQVLIAAAAAEGENGKGEAGNENGTSEKKETAVTNGASAAADAPDDLPAAFAPTKGHFGPVHTLAFTADGSAIASGSEDGCVRIHHTREFSEVVPVVPPVAA